MSFRLRKILMAHRKHLDVEARTERRTQIEEDHELAEMQAREMIAMGIDATYSKKGALHIPTFYNGDNSRLEQYLN